MFKKFNFYIVSRLVFITVLGVSVYFIFCSKDIVFLCSWKLFRWGASHFFEFPVLLDKYRIIFVASVSVIALAVMVFSKTYIAHEKYFLRFHLLVLSFVASIFLLILRPNLISILFGWDGLGVTSYLLVIYFQSSKSYNAGIVTALRNRVGDVLILLSIGGILINSSWNFIISFIDLKNFYFYIFIILLVIASCTKRAQIPFSAWLPAAMAAPTPVSSLVHSSTLVTAGVYLIIRFSDCLSNSFIAFFLLFLGTLTMLIAGGSALFEIDMKKIVALSTLSQLGLIIRALGMGLYDIAFFHILTHAYFKALLFMTVGNIIHMRRDYQDLRKVGVCINTSSATISFSLVRNISLCGAPFIAGFYSKDVWLELANIKNISSLIFVGFYLATILTAVYTLRFICLIIVRQFKVVCSNVKDLDWQIITAMSVLWPLAIIGGRILRWTCFTKPFCVHLNIFTKNLTLLVIVVGVIIRFFIFKNFYRNKSLQKRFWSLGVIWALPLITTPLINYFSLNISHMRRNYIDLFWSHKTLFLLVEKVRLSNQEIYKNKIRRHYFYLIVILFLIIFRLTYLHILNLFKSWKFKISYAKHLYVKQ